MKKTTTARERRRYHQWYQKNGAALRARRRKKYRSDSAFRERHIQRVRSRYWERRPKVVMAKVKTRKVKPSFHWQQGTMVQPAYGIADVAKMFGRTRRTVLFWINSRVLPKPLHTAVERRSIRVYTADEFALMKKHAGLLAWPKLTLASSVFAKTLRREMAYLRRGLLKV